MSDPTRREVLAGAALLLPAVALARDDKKPAQSDRDCVIAAGLTPQEADAWEAVATAAGKFFDLPKLHSMDDHEVAHAIHVVQHKLLARPAYRKYLELSKAAAEKK